MLKFNKIISIYFKILEISINKGANVFFFSCTHHPQLVRNYIFKTFIFLIWLIRSYNSYIIIGLRKTNICTKWKMTLYKTKHTHTINHWSNRSAAVYLKAKSTISACLFFRWHEYLSIKEIKRERERE